MRSVPVLVALAHLVGLAVLGTSCADDTATPSTTTSADSAPTSQTAAPSSSTTTTTSTTTSTVPVTTTTSEPDDPFASFTTTEMKDRLAGSHVYLGGTVLSRGAEFAIEQWGLGAGSVEDWYATGGSMEIWFEELVERTADGTPVWSRQAVLPIEIDPTASVSGFCRVDGLRVEGVFGVVVSRPDLDEQWLPVERSWRADFDARTVAELTGDVECENEAYGL